MRAHLIPITLVALTLVAVMARPLLAAGRVQLELVGEARESALVFQEWLRVLGQAGVKNVRIRSAGAANRVGIEVRGTEKRPLYVVTGVVKSRDELLLPAGRFTRRDAARLAQWLEDLARHGPADRREAKSAFGLSAEQFEQVRKDLSRPVEFSTKGMARHEVVARIGALLSAPLELDSRLAETLQADTIGEELSGISCGTVLAFVLRPTGLCMVPRREDQAVVYGVLKAKSDMELWPVGWELDAARRDVLPAMFEMRNVNIQGVSAATALEAIGKRLGVAVLIDHKALARHGIDPHKAMVSYPKKRTTYSFVLRKILFQARLRSEVRVDEAGKPLLWISTLKPL